MTTEEEGIKAILVLQALAGVGDTEEQAKTGWRRMNKLEKEFTIKAYEALSKLIESSETTMLRDEEESNGKIH